jgi:O-antigen/teichoic acid export membrane protein
MLKQLRQKTYHFLRWSERHTKTDMVYLTKGGFWLSIGKVVASLSSFALAMAFANLISQQTYGNFRYVLTIFSTISILGLPGLNSSVFRSVSRGFEGALQQGFKKRAQWGVFGGLVILGVGLYYIYFQHSTMLGISIIIIGFLMPFLETFTLTDSFLLGKKMFQTSTTFFVIEKIIHISVMITTLFLTKNLVIIILVYGLTLLTIRSVLFLWTINRFQNNKNKEEGIISYGKQLTFLKGMTSVSGSINNIVLFNLLGAQNLALFSLAIAPIEQIRSLFKIGENLLLPKLAHDSWSVGSLKRFTLKLLPFTLSLIAIIVVYILLAPTVFALFFPRYLAAVSLSQLYAATLLFTAFNIVQNTILKAKKMIREQYIVGICDLILTLGLGISLIHFLGVKGLIICYIIEKVVIFSLIMYLLFRNKQTINTDTHYESKL